jgi:hypothetical protein
MDFEIEEDSPVDVDRSGALPFEIFVADEQRSRMAVQAIVYAYLGVRGGVSSQEQVRFPGPNPISMDVEHLDLMSSREYVMSRKVDGTRYQIVCLGPVSSPSVILADRSMRLYTATYGHLPDTWFSAEGTVLDAELVLDTLYVFDVVMMRGQRLERLDYRSRMATVTADDAAGGMEIGFGSRHLLNVVSKPFYPLSYMKTLLSGEERGAPSGAIPSDGLVFTPVHEPIKLFTHWTMFKVKEHHTIDMRLVLVPRRPTHHMPTDPSSSSSSSFMRGPGLALIESMRGPILRNAIVASSVAAAAPLPVPVPVPVPPPAPQQPRSLVQMVGIKKFKPGVSPGPRTESHQEPSLAQPTSAAPATSLAAQPTCTPPRMQWITRLEYSKGDAQLDATTTGVDYSGITFLFRIREDETLSRLLDRLETVWRDIDGEVVTLSLIVECKLLFPPSLVSWIKAVMGGTASVSACPSALTTSASSSSSSSSAGGGHREGTCGVARDLPFIEVCIDRVRPDKLEPNSYMTITRTLTSILSGVTFDHLLSKFGDPKKA